MTKRLCFTVAVFALFVAGLTAQTTAGKRTIRVDVTYTGSGTVDASHKIYVALWDSTDLQHAEPVAVEPLESKKGTVTFSDVQKVPAYASVAFDPTGAWDAKSAPPSGSSLGMYSKNPPAPDPIDVAPGKSARVAITFNDAVKVP